MHHFSLVNDVISLLKVSLFPINIIKYDVFYFYWNFLELVLVLGRLVHLNVC